MPLLPNMRLIMNTKIDHTAARSTCTWQKCRVVEIVNIVPVVEIVNIVPVVEIVDNVSLKFASNEAAGWKVDILEPLFYSQ